MASSYQKCKPYVSKRHHRQLTVSTAFLVTATGIRGRDRARIGRAESAKTDLERDLFLQMAKAWIEAALIASGASPGPGAGTRPPSYEDGASA